MIPAYLFLCLFHGPSPISSSHLESHLEPIQPAHPAVASGLENQGAVIAFSSPSCPLASPNSDTNKQMATSETKMNPCFLPAHHPTKAVIRDVLCGGLEIILGGGLVIQQWPTAGLAVSLLA